MALRAVGVAFHAVGVVSRAESLSMWLLQYRMASATNSLLFQLNLISHYLSISKRSFGHGKTSWQNGLSLSFLSYLFDGV